MSERGFTIVELLVAMTLGLVVLTACVAVLTGAIRRADAVDRRTDSQLRARVALDTAQRSLRAQACVISADGVPTPPVVAATASAVTFYADLAGTGVPVQRRLELRADATFTETVWATPGNPVTRRLATGMSPSGSAPVFRYFAYDTTMRPPQPTKELVPGSGGLSAAARAQVAKVDIRVLASPTSATAAGTEVRDSALVRLTDPDGATVPQCI